MRLRHLLAALLLAPALATAQPVAVHPEFLAGSGTTPTLDLNFLGGALPAAATWSGGLATEYDASGNLIYAPHNLLPDSAGVGSGATNFPSGWGCNGACTQNGITAAVVNSGTENGLPFIDVAYSGTATAAGNFPRVTFATTQIAAVPGQPSTCSFYPKLVSGSIAGVSFLLEQIYSTSGSSFISNTTSTFTPGSGTLGTARVSASAPATGAPATTGLIGCDVPVSYSNGQALAFTLRYGAPQLEENAYATSYVPTTGAAAYSPRFSYDPTAHTAQGLQIEASSQNELKNGTGQGASAGTYPTNWANAGNASGITQTVVGQSSENGLACVDFAISGTTTGGGNLFSVFTEGTQEAAAVQGQTVTLSGYWRLSAGGPITGNIAIGTYWTEFNSSGAAVSSGQGSQSLAVPTSGPAVQQRVQASYTAQSASSAYVQPQFYITANVAGVALPAGTVLRLCDPQLEQGATATSAIPTYGTALTRTADSVTAPGRNCLPGIGGSIAAQALIPSTPGAAQFLFDLGDGTTSNELYANVAGATVNAAAQSGGSGQTASGAALWTAGAVGKAAASVTGAGSLTAAANATALAVTGTAQAMTALPTLYLGRRGNASAWLNGYLQRLRCWASPLSLSALQGATR